MKKLTMRLDALQVESFDLMPEGARAFGTVRGHDRAEENAAAFETTQEDSNCPIYSCGCSDGVPFTQCDCETIGTGPVATGGNTA